MNILFSSILLNKSSISILNLSYPIISSTNSHELGIKLVSRLLSILWLRFRNALKLGLSPFSLLISEYFAETVTI